MSALTKALTAYACLQIATHRRSLERMKLRVVYDCTVLKESERVEADTVQASSSYRRSEDLEQQNSGNGGTRRRKSSIGDELLMTDVRSAMEQGRRWEDDRTPDEDSGIVPERLVLDTGTAVDDSEEESNNIVHGLEEMIGGEDLTEKEGEGLSREIELALEQAARHGTLPDGLGDIVTAPDGRRLARIKRLGGAVFEIETTTTLETRTTTTTLRAEASSSRNDGGLRNSFGGLGEDDWVEIGERETQQAIVAEMDQNSTVGALARQDTIDNPRESGQKLQVGTRD
jgi:hypothetical protein